MGKREIRVLLLGSSGAGKTALAVMFERKYFVKTYEQTTVAEAHRREVTVDNQQIQMEILDCGAPSQLPEYTQYIKNADGIVAVYDITSLPSFSKIEPIVRYAQQHKQCPCILVGTKQDKEKERAIRPQDGTALANDLGCPFLEITATSEDAVAGMFRLLAKLILDESDPTKKQKKGGLKRLLKFKKKQNDPTAPGVYEEDDEEPELQQHVPHIPHVPSGDSVHNAARTSPFRPLNSEPSQLSVSHGNPNGQSGAIPHPSDPFNATKSASATIRGFELIHFMTELKELLIQNKDFSTLQAQLTQERERRIELELQVIKLEKEILFYKKTYGDLQ